MALKHKLRYNNWTHSFIYSMKAPSVVAAHRSAHNTHLKLKLKQKDVRIKARPRSNIFVPSENELIALIRSKIAQGLEFKSPGQKNWIRAKSIKTIKEGLFSSSSSVPHDFKSLVCSQWKLMNKDMQEYEVPDHPQAQARTDYFVAKVMKIFARNSDIYVITLDGRLRTSMALIAAGIPANRIIVIEWKEEVALYQKLLAACTNPSECINVIFSGEHQSKQSGIQGYILNNLFSKHNLIDPDVLSKTVALYLDFCGDLPANMNTVLKQLPKLQLYGWTRAHRNTKRKPAEFPVPNQFTLIRRFNQTQVLSCFFGKGASVCKKGAEDQEYVVDRIETHWDDPKRPGRRLYQVRWKNFGPKESSWEPAEEIEKCLLQWKEYEFACLRYPDVKFDPVFYLRRDFRPAQ